MSRVRSSSRWSMRLRRSSWPTGRTTPIACPLRSQESVREAGWSSRRASPVTPSGSAADGSSSERVGRCSGAPNASCSSSLSLSLPVIESLNSRMPEPSCRPKPGSRFGPKMMSTIRRRITSSRGPMFGIRANVLRNVAERITMSANAPVPYVMRPDVKAGGRAADEVPTRSHDMSRQPENNTYVRRVVLPSGKTIEVVYFGDVTDATRPTPEPAEDLHVCGTCECELVYPVDWEESGDTHWEVTLRCPNCEWAGTGIFEQDIVERFDEELDRGTEALVRDLKNLMQANMEDEIERFVSALEAGHIIPEDF